MAVVAKPVIFLAFANDREEQIRYLRNLPEEARRLRILIERAANLGLCELVLRQNATPDEIFDVFQAAPYRNRIAIFHYGGHANGYQLLLETAAGKPALISAGGLAAFLGQQVGLELVFLNGCSTQQQVQGLLDAGVSTVIATSQAINDAVATNFAIRFYQGLTNGASLLTAFNEAVAAIKTTHGSDLRQLYYVGTAGQAQPVPDRWPWAHYVRPGAETALRWNLPDAAGDPLFDLPPIPQKYYQCLPDNPFRGLTWFATEHAALFFGRGYQIRALYQQIVAPQTPPLLLFYGQSGVGKSSLLAAGLMPRLESSHTVVYLRRNQSPGLLGALQAALMDKADARSVLDAWSALEARDKRPLLIIVDQIEEVFTRPNPEQPQELADFLTALQALGADPDRWPQGKLILSFRKEWLAEIKRQVEEHKLPQNELFLQRLDKRGVREAINGLTQLPTLQAKYRLTVDSELPELIADDLLADSGSAVASILQILLTKLWKTAKVQSYDEPMFNLELYAQLRKQGLELGDILKQQMAALKQQMPEVVASGLALDLLVFHTTSLGTAEEHSRTELNLTYAHQQAIIAPLVQECGNLYLLVDPARNEPTRPPASRLAHDTLAPFVRAQFETSDLPGQRARRILENKSILKRFGNNLEVDATNAAQPGGRFAKWLFGAHVQRGLKYLNAKLHDRFVAPLDKPDLWQVEAGKAGMRAWTDEEAQLVEASRKAHRRRAVVSYAVVALIVMIGALNLIQRNQRLNGLREEQIVQARSAAMRSLNLTVSNPITGAQLAVAVLPGPTPQPYVPDAEFAYTEALQNDREIQRRQVATALRINAPIARHGDALAIGSDTVTIISAATLRTRQLAPTGSLPILGVAWSTRGELLSYTESQMQFWPLSPSEGLGTGEPITIPPAQGRLACAEWRPDQQQVAVCLGKTLAIWQPGQATIQPIYTFTKTVVGDLDRRRTRWSPKGRWLTAWDENRRLALWNAETAITVTQATSHTERIWDIAWSPNENYLVTVSGDRTAKVWSIPNLQPKATVSLTVVAQASANRIDSAGVAFLDNEHFLTWGFDNIVRQWSVAGQLVQAYVADGDVVTDAKIIQQYGETWLFAFLRNGRVQQWAVRIPQTANQSRSYIGHTGRVLAIDWQGDYLATASLDGTVRIWDATTGAERALLVGHQAARNSTRNDVLAIFWEQDQSLITVGLDGTVRRWRFDPQKDPFCTAKGSAQSPACYGLSHVVKLAGSAIQQAQWLDDTAIVAVNSRGRVSVWSEGQAPKAILPPDQDHWVKLSPDGKWFVAIQKSGGALARDGQLWDVLAGKQALTLTGPISQVQWLAEGPLVSGPTAPPLLYPVGKGEKTQVGVSGEAYTAAQATTDQLATANEQGLIQIWAWPSAKLRTQWAVHESAEIATLLWRAHGQQLLTVTTQGALTLWDAASGKQLWRVHALPATVASLAFSPDEQWLAVAQDQAFFVLEANTGIEHKRYDTPGATVNGVQWVMRRGWAQVLPKAAFDTQVYHYLLGNSGERLDDPQLLLMTWGGDGEVHFWHWDSLVEVLRLRETRLPEINNRWPINVAVLNANRARLVTAGNSRELRIWQLWLDQPERLLGVWTARQSMRAASQ